MPEAWMPAVGRLRNGQDGGPAGTGAPRVVWQATESDPHAVSARSAAERLHADGLDVHLVWNPVTGETVQMLPATTAGLGLRGDGGDPGPGREGRVCLQIKVVAQSARPFTAGPLLGLDPIMRWIDSWAVVRRWRGGPPMAAPSAYDDPGSLRLWALGGHFGHSQVPGRTAMGPGSVDISKIIGPAPAAPSPALPTFSTRPHHHSGNGHANGRLRTAAGEGQRKEHHLLDHGARIPVSSAADRGGD
ncbi:hypothetical protein CLV72_10998 [Allonocardiopsis opalescens]|uniref:Uncharacterized protein n=1 Tax=Allonocardiopsis opalescens TaxID=1144618 RepID=A0A2T0PVM7_9ACTN|nr:hypothetical protein CLV72_10998 [Allonocardiopsis opalescens]